MRKHIVVHQQQEWTRDMVLQISSPLVIG